MITVIVMFTYINTTITVILAKIIISTVMTILHIIITTTIDPGLLVRDAVPDAVADHGVLQY